MKLLIIALLFTFAATPMYEALCYERSDAFIVRLFDTSIKVLAPSKYDPKLNIIVENKTLSSAMLKLEKENGSVVKFISVEPGKFRATELQAKKGETLYLVPISPPFQKVELVIGRKPYEIPPKR